MALREILAKFDVDISGAKKGLNEGSTLVDRLADKLAKVGAGVAGFFAAKHFLTFNKNILLAADGVAKTADALRIGVQEWQEWEYAAEQSNIASQTMSAALTRLQRGLGAAAKGGGPAADAFRRLRVDIRDSEGQLRGITPVLDDVIESLNLLENETERNALLIDLFGQQGAKLNPLFQQGAEGIRAARAEMEALGFGFSEDFARQSEEFSSNLTRLQRGVQGLTIQVLGPLLPTILQVTDGMIRMIRVGVTFGRRLREWTQQSAAAEAALTMLAVGGLAATAKGVATLVVGLGGLRGAFLRLLPFIWKIVVPFLVLEDLFVFLMGGSSALGRAIDGIFGEGAAEEFRKAIHELFDEWRNFKKDWESGDIAALVRHAFSPLTRLFAGLGDLVLEGLADAWNWFVEKTGSVGEKLGLRKLSTEELRRDKPSDMEHQLEQTHRIRSGQETAEQRAAREVALPGAIDVQRALSTQQQLAENLQDFSATLKATESWATSPAAVTTQPVSHHHDYDVRVAPHTSVTVHVPPGTDATLAKRVGSETGKAVTGAFDLRAAMDALVPQPG